MSTKSISASSEAGPSRRTPIRSLRQPALLNIAIRNDAGGLEPPSHSDAVALKMAMERKVQWRRKGERWMDRLCEGTVSAEEFKRGAKYLEHHQYLETLHERHLNSLCSYPLCPNPPAAPYTSRPRISISIARKAIEQKEGNEEDGFCSRVCKLRSGYLGDQMKEGTGVRGRGWEVELLEEVRPEVGAGGKGREGKEGSEGAGKAGSSKPSVRPPAEKKTSPAATGDGLASSAPTAAAKPASSSPRTKQSSDPRQESTTTAALTHPSPPPPTSKPLSERPPPKVAPPAPTYPPQPQSKLDDLLAGLVIVERPTLPPSTTPNPSITHPNPTSPPSTAPAHISPPPTTKPLSLHTKSSSARASSSLIATPLKLATTLITASRLTGPVPQLAEDSDGESELSEWEMEMDGFGGLGEEEKALFEEMRAAREFVEGGS